MDHSPHNTRADWLAQRRTGIGGSDAAAVLGLSKWRTPLSVWLDKTGQSDGSDETPAMRWGTLLEPVIRQEYAERTGRTVTVPGLIRHARHDHMIANVDGVSGDGRIVEIKTTRTADGWGEPGSDEVPEDYLIQVQHYMAVLALPVADIAVLVGGSDFRIYTVAADAELQDMIVSTEREFWQMVRDRVAPPAVSYADVQAMYGRSARTDSSICADAALIDVIADLRDATAARKAMEADEEALKAAVMAAMGEHDTVRDAADRVLATWKLAAAPKRLDAKALAAAHPAIHAAFLKEGEPSRRFIAKEGK